MYTESLSRADIILYPLTKKQTDKMINDWHSHHKPVVGYKFAIGARLATGPKEDLGCVIIGRPSAQALDNGSTWEVTRLCCRGGDKNLASMLLGAAWNASWPQGIRHMISYTRKDEDGTCYRASGWAPQAEVTGRPWTGGNKATRWLPGFYEPSSEIVDRIRWEKRPTEDIRAVSRLLHTLANLGSPRGAATTS